MSTSCQSTRLSIAHCSFQKSCCIKLREPVHDCAVKRERIVSYFMHFYSHCVQYQYYFNYIQLHLLFRNDPPSSVSLEFLFLWQVPSIFEEAPNRTFCGISPCDSKLSSTGICIFVLIISCQYILFC